MSVAVLIAIGVLTGLTTVLFGFGGGFVTVPVVTWVDAAAGPAVATIAVGTSALVMVVNAAAATVATPRATLSRLRHCAGLLALLGAGGVAGAVAATFAPAWLIHWGFAAYLAITILDVLARPGFLRPGAGTAVARTRFAIPAVLGLPIGAVASFLGVGGSVMTVPLLRRSGLGMGIAAALANPLTLCVSVPACALFLLTGHATAAGTMPLAVGSIDLGSAALLLAGAVPVVVLLRRRPPRLPDRLHALGYVALLLLVLLATLLHSA